MKLFLASMFTLGILFLMFFSFVLFLFSLYGMIDVFLVIFLTGILFFLYWLLSPYFTDLVLGIFHKLKWIDLKKLKEMDPELANFLLEVCKKNNIKIPKLGFIEDDNPTAFCYGSAAFNARIVFTQGLFRYLESDERKAVIAHEIGHIVHRDFIIMTLAAFLLTLLYNISRSLMKWKGEKKKNIGVLAGIIAYVFYLIGNYIVLFLSRLREYYADEFSAKLVGSDALARALLKVAYGILAKPDTEAETSLMNATRPLGLVDPKGIKSMGLAYANGKLSGNEEPLLRAFLFDLHNPWAFWIELNSTHPLIAKRIKRLDEIGTITSFNFQRIKRMKVDKKKLYAGFAKDVLINILPFISSGIIAFIFIFIVTRYFSISTLPAALFSIAMFLFYLFFLVMGISLILKAFYRYPKKQLAKTNILELLGDVYASPVKGRYVELKGKIIGRGIPGLIIGEDMMLQDPTGLIFLNYEGLIPGLGNLIFAVRRVNKLIGKDVKVRGWFLRGATPRIELDEIVVMKEGRRIKSYVRFWAIGIGIIFFMFLLFTLPIFL